MLDLKGHLMWSVLGGCPTCHDDFLDVRMNEEWNAAEAIFPATFETLSISKVDTE